MTKDELKAWLIEKGYQEDRFGHFKKMLARRGGHENAFYRYKLNAAPVRYETQCRHSDGSTSWVRLRSGYYRNLSITEDRKLSGMKP